MSIQEPRRKLFISHASEDKDSLVRPLVEALSDDCDVWYDDRQLVVGMSLLQEINKGLASCDFGVVVLSPNFFAKKWPQSELDGLFALETANRKIILPVWHDIDEEAVKRHSPVLAGRLAAKSSDGLDRVVDELRRAVSYFETGKAVQGPSAGYHKLLSSLQKEEDKQHSRMTAMSEQGEKLASAMAKQTIEILATKAAHLQEQGMRAVRCGEPQFNDNPWYVNIELGRLMLRAQYLRSSANSAINALLIMKILERPDSFDEIRSPFNTLDEETYIPFFDRYDVSGWKPENSESDLFSPDTIVDEWLGKLSEAFDAFQERPEVNVMSRQRRVYR